MLARKTVFVILKEGIAGALGFITLFFVARFMGAEPLGVASFALAFVNVFNIIADMGFNAAHVKRVSEKLDLRNCIAVYARIKIVLTLAALGILVCFLVLLEILKVNFYDSTYPEVVYMMIGYFMFVQIMSIPKYTYDAKLQIYRSQLAALAGVIGKDILVIGAAVLMTIGPYTVVQKGVALAVGYMLEVLIATVILYGFFIREEKIGTYDRRIARRYLEFAIPFFPVAIFSMLAINADRLTIGYFWDAKEVGVYTAVQAIANMLVVIQSAVTLVLFPAVSSQHKGGNLNEVVRMTKDAMQYILLVLMPVGAAITVFSADIIHVVLSDEFLVAEYCFIFLTWYYILFSVSNTAAVTIGGTDRPKLGARITLVSAISNILLNFAFVPWWGATGAALATLMSGVVYFILAAYFSRKVLSANIFPLRAVKIMAAGGITVLLFYAMKFTILPPPTEMRIYTLVPTLLGMLGFFLLVLHLAGEFGKKEIEFFKNALHIREMGRGIREEIKIRK
ncbi:MAG: flippase [Thermoplasmata archaeon]|nr:flippase [Thermoplasmata archaeon]